MPQGIRAGVLTVPEKGLLQKDKFTEPWPRIWVSNSLILFQVAKISGCILHLAAIAHTLRKMSVK